MKKPCTCLISIKMICAWIFLKNTFIEWINRTYGENVQKIPLRLINLSIHNRKTHFIWIYCKIRKSEKYYSPWNCQVMDIEHQVWKIAKSIYYSILCRLFFECLTLSFDHCAPIWYNPKFYTTHEIFNNFIFIQQKLMWSKMVLI